MAEIKLDDAQFKATLDAAVLAAIGQAGREQIIKEAVDYLTRAERSSYGPDRSRLQRIIADAAEKIAEKVLEDKFASDPEFVQKVEALYAEAFRKVFDTETREKLVSKLADAMSKAISGDRY